MSSYGSYHGSDRITLWLRQKRRNTAVKMAQRDITWPQDALFYAIAFFVLGDSSASVLTPKATGFSWLG